MALQDFVSDSEDEDLPECPSCGEKGEDTERVEFRCTTSHSECEVLYWFEPEYNGGQRQ